MKENIVSKLKLDWSPEQISGRLLREEKIKVSHETIYQFVYEEIRKGEKLWVHLRRRRKHRRARSAAKKTFNIGVRVGRAWIESRPKVVEERIRLGDFERDTVEGIRSGSLLLTMVDRVSRLTIIKWIPRKNAALIHHATVEALKGTVLNTITNDNGAEFGFHDMTEIELKTPIYFSRPYHSWQRGTIENTNGLIRQYFPKGQDLDPSLVQKTEDLLNTRPRKCLGYRTPTEVHDQLSRVLR